jgi:hypothetical protein
MQTIPRISLGESLGKCVMNTNEEFIKKLEKMRDYGKTFNPY